jgi:hypothetical protein
MFSGDVDGNDKVDVFKADDVLAFLYTFPSVCDY